MNRLRLPDRRPSITRAVVWQTPTGVFEFTLSIGIDPRTGRIGDVFYSDGQKSGSQMQAAVQDACVQISLALQHGVPLAALSHSMSACPLPGGGDAPGSVLGAILGALVAEAEDLRRCEEVV